MKKKKIRLRDIKKFEEHLYSEEKSKATIEKYIRDIKKFSDFLGNNYLDKESAIRYKTYLAERYTPASVNSMIASLNCYFRFEDMEAFCVRYIKVQKQIFARQDKELSRLEYKRLLDAADDEQTSLMIRTMCGTGIRVSELRYITAEAVVSGKAVVDCKNKKRIILIPALMQEFLIPYIKKSGIESGPIFLSKNGNPIDRTSIWRKMKELCEISGVNPEKVFPHNLRHLFARTFYSIDGDIVRLADVLGHSNINTTRIYTMEAGRQHMDMLDQLQDVLTT